MARRDSARTPAVGAAAAVAQRLADELRGEAGRSVSGPPEGCVSWVPWTGQSTPR